MNVLQIKYFKILYDKKKIKINIFNYEIKLKKEI